MHILFFLTHRHVLKYLFNEYDKHPLSIIELVFKLSIRNLNMKTDVVHETEREQATGL